MSQFTWRWVKHIRRRSTSTVHTLLSSWCAYISSSPVHLHGPPWRPRGELEQISFGLVKQACRSERAVSNPWKYCLVFDCAHAMLCCILFCYLSLVWIFFLRWFCVTLSAHVGRIVPIVLVMRLSYFTCPHATLSVFMCVGAFPFCFCTLHWVLYVCARAHTTLSQLRAVELLADYFCHGKYYGLLCLYYSLSACSLQSYIICVIKSFPCAAIISSICFEHIVLALLLCLYCNIGLFLNSFWLNPNPAGQPCLASWSSQLCSLLFLLWCSLVFCFVRVFSLLCYG